MALTDGIKNKLTEIADAIRSKTNKSEELTLEQMASEVESIDVMQGFDYKGVVSPQRANELNEYYKNAISRAKQFTDTWDKNTKTLKIQYDNDVVFLNIDTSNVTDAYYGLRNDYFLEEVELDLRNCNNISGLFFKNHSLRNIKIKTNDKITSVNAFCYHCFMLENIPQIDYSNVTDFNNSFQYCSNIRGDVYIDTRSATDITNFAGYWECCDKLVLTSIKNVTKANNAFAANNTQIILFTEWRQTSINLTGSKNLSSESIKYNIWHALNGNNALGFENQGATSRILQLHATPYASWEEWKTTKPSVEDCEFLGIGETEITKYGELTWEDIALDIKLITIAK